MIAATEPVRTERAERDRRRTTMSVCASPTRAEQHGAQRRRSARAPPAPATPTRGRCSATPTRRRRTGRRRPASAPNVPIAGTPLGDQVGASRTTTSTRKPRNAIAAGRAHAVGHGVDRAARRVAERCAAGRRCAGGGRRTRRAGAVLDTCSSRSSESCTWRSGLRPLAATPRRRRTCTRLREPAADGGARPAGLPGDAGRRAPR